MLLNTKSIWSRNYTWRDKDKRTFKSRRITDLFEMSCFGTNLLNLAGDRFLTRKKKKQFPSSHSLFDATSFLESKLLNFAIIACVLKRFQSSFCAKVRAGNGRL